jgi:hypothetical protein
VGDDKGFPHPLLAQPKTPDHIMIRTAVSVQVCVTPEILPGYLHVIDVAKKELLETTFVAKTAIKARPSTTQPQLSPYTTARPWPPRQGLSVSHNGKHLLVNSTDRKIRLFDTEAQPRLLPLFLSPCPLGGGTGCRRRD